MTIIMHRCLFGTYLTRRSAGCKGVSTVTRGVVDGKELMLDKLFIAYVLIVVSCRHRLVLTAEGGGFVKQEVGDCVLDGKLNVI